MADDSGSDDKHLDTLDFVMKSLQEHENAIDDLIDALKTYTKTIPNALKLKERIHRIDQNVDSLQKQIADLSSYLKTDSNKTAPLTSSQKAAESALPIASLSAEAPIIIRCQRWNEFLLLAKQAQKVSVSYQTDKKLFEVNALKGKHLIVYAGDFPDLTPAMRTFLSSMLGIGEQAIFEGSLAVPK